MSTDDIIKAAFLAGGSPLTLSNPDVAVTMRPDRKTGRTKFIIEVRGDAPLPQVPEAWAEIARHAPVDIEIVRAYAPLDLAGSCRCQCAHHM